MPEKLLTLRELSEYLQIKEERIASFVEGGVISAYKIGGELLRFRRSQIDAIRAEIESRVVEADRMVPSHARERVGLHHSPPDERPRSTIGDRVSDFFYFNDFYIVSIGLIAVLVMIIFY